MSRESKLAEALAWLLTFIAWGLSFASQVQLAEVPQHKLPWPEPLLFAATTDLVAGAAMLLGRDRAGRGLSTRELWALSAAAAAMMIGANVAIGWPDLIGIAMHVWAPVMAVWMWHALLYGRRPISVSRPEIQEEKTATGQDSEPVPAETGDFLQETSDLVVPPRKSRSKTKAEKARALLSVQRELLVANGRANASARVALIKQVATRIKATQKYVRDIADAMERETRQENSVDPCYG